MKAKGVTNVGCAQAFWRKMSEPERVLWLKFYEAFDNMSNLPNAARISAATLEIVAHNMAVQAIWAMREPKPRKRARK